MKISVFTFILTVTPFIAYGQPIVQKLDSLTQSLSNLEQALGRDAITQIIEKKLSDFKKQSTTLQQSFDDLENLLDRWQKLSKQSYTYDFNKVIENPFSNVNKKMEESDIQIRGLALFFDNNKEKMSKEDKKIVLNIMQSLNNRLNSLLSYLNTVQFANAAWLKNKKNETMQFSDFANAIIKNAKKNIQDDALPELNKKIKNWQTFIAQ